MALKRRAFLQAGLLAGGMIAAEGLSQSLLGQATSRYYHTLAQPARRRLALLVGINQYPESVCDYVSPRGSALGGCLTDVELQSMVLQYRFGFQPRDILVLTDRAATRQGIAEAFLDHLIGQANPGDLVVFHFSGLGSQVRLEGDPNVAQASLVPIDGFLPTAETPIIHDLLQDTLGLLLSALPTKQVIAVIDAGYSNVGRTLQGNLRLRSRPVSPVGMVCEAERLLQEQLMGQTRLSIEQIRQRWRTGQFPGLLLQAGSFDRVVTEAQWSGYSAGLFTAALTQQFWATTPATPIWVNFQQAATTVRQIAGLQQQPNLSGQLAPVSLDSFNPISADGVIRSIDDEGRAQVWLAGLPTPVLENATLLWCSLVNPAEVGAEAVPFPTLQIRSRDGLVGRSRSLRSSPTASGSMALSGSSGGSSAGSSAGSSGGSTLPLAPGQLVQELVRVLPRNLGLTVAIDNELARIERVDATSAFAAIPRVSSVMAGEQPADLFFGKMQTASLLAASLPLSNATPAPASLAPSSPAPATQDAPASDLPDLPNLPPESASQYGLFSPGRSAIPSTLIRSSEAVKAAINRMTPQLKTLLALKLLRLTQNQASSHLGVRVLLETTEPQVRLIANQATSRLPTASASSRLTVPPPIEQPTATVPLGSQIRYRLYNYGSQPIYFLLIGVDTRGNPLLFAPPVTNSNEEPSRPELHPQEILTLPIDRSGWTIQRPTGLAETHLIFSPAPFRQTEQILKGRTSQITDPLEIVQAILQDLHQASAPLVAKLEIPADSYALDVRAWATLSFVYQVVAA